MKKISLSVVMIVLATTVFSQQARINLYGNYLFDDVFDSRYDNNNYYSININGGFQWGAGFEYMIQPKLCVELMYLHQTTNSPASYRAGAANPESYEDFDLKLDYLLLGSEAHLARDNRKLESFMGIFLGTCFLNINDASSGYSASDTRFAAAIRAGGNIWIGSRVAVKVQAQLLSIFNAGGGEFYFGSYGTGAGLNNYSTIYQFGFGGGVSFRFGGDWRKKENMVR